MRRLRYGRARLRRLCRALEGGMRSAGERARMNVRIDFTITLDLAPELMPASRRDELINTACAALRAELFSGESIVGQRFTLKDGGLDNARRA